MAWSKRTAEIRKSALGEIETITPLVEGDYKIRVGHAGPNIYAMGERGEIWIGLTGTMRHARLFSAAPELLEAVKACRLAMGFYGVVPGDPAWAMSQLAMEKTEG